MSSAGKYRWTRKDGSSGSAWRARWIGADGKPHDRRGFDRKADALAFARDREAERAHGVTLGSTVPSGGMTLAAWSEQWLSSRRVRPQTLLSYRYALRRVLTDLGGRRLSTLRPSELDSWRSALFRRYGDGATAHQTVAVLAMVLRAAVVDGLIPSSPLRPERRGQASVRVVDPDELLTVEQVRAWDAALPDHARGMALLAATTGLRQGELLGLRAANVDWLRRRVRVVEQLVTPPSGEPTWGPPKTSAGVRTAPLPAMGAEVLAAHIEAFPSPEDEPLFLSGRGRRWRRQTFGDVWRKAREQAGLPDWAHWHGLRDVALSGYVRAGVDVRTVMAIAGHSSPDETLVTYSRLWADAGDVARAAVERLWEAPSAMLVAKADSSIG